MTAQTITAQTSESDPVEFEYDFGDNLGEAVEIFGEDICYAHIKRSLTVAVQGAARTLIRAGKSRDEIVDAMAEWRPDMPRQAKTAEEKLRDMFEGLDPEARKRLLAELKPGKAD